LKKIIAVSGYAKTGKTTFIQKIIEKLSEGNLRIQTIKHSIHPLRFGEETDSVKHMNSGAVKTIAIGPGMIQIVEKMEIIPTLENIIGTITDCELVIIEGFKKEKYDRIWISGIGEKEEIPENSGVMAVGGFDGLGEEGAKNKNLPYFNIGLENDVEEAVKFIKEYIKG